MSECRQIEREAREVFDAVLGTLPPLQAYQLGFAAGLQEAARRIRREEDREHWESFISKSVAPKSSAEPPK